MNPGSGADLAASFKAIRTRSCWSPTRSGPALKGIRAAGTGTTKDPKCVALQVVIDKMNDLFGAESFTASQIREFVQGLVERLLADPNLVKQTKANSTKLFLESPDFQAEVRPP